jgi:hypothetical protein
MLYHTSFQIGESYAVDWEWQEIDGKKWRSIPNTPRPVQPQRDPRYATQAEHDEPKDDDIPF